MYDFIYWLTLGALGAVVFASFFEWTLHRFLMHRPMGRLTYPFRTHTLIHHHTFKADDTYHLINEADREMIPMAWWNGPLLIVTCMLPNLGIAWATGRWPMTLGALVAFAAYYGTYEYLHWCMHLPKQRRLERSHIFHRLNGHHLLHHRYMHKNFNVVLPLADLCLGTLLLRSKFKFAQATGPSVPNVQPRD
jgi:hypothetical protein